MATRGLRWRGGTLSARLLAAVTLLATILVFGVGSQPAAAAAGITGSVEPLSSTTFGKTVTFSGMIMNTGAVAAEELTALTVSDSGSAGLTVGAITLATPVTDAARLSAPGSVEFSGSAVVTAAPGAPTKLRLVANGTTAAAAAVATPVFMPDVDVNATDAVVLTVTAQRNQAGADPALSACPAPNPAPPPLGGCTVSINDGIKYSVTVTNLSDVPAIVTLSAPVPANATEVPVDLPGIPLVNGLPIALTAAGGAIPSLTFTREVAINDTAQPTDLVLFSATATYAATSGLTVLTVEPAEGSPFAFNSMVVDPRLIITNMLTDTDGGQLVRGDAVGSVIRIENTGNTDATKVEVTASLTNLTTPGDVTIKLNGGADDAAGARATKTSGSSTSIVVARVGTGANGGSGGTLAPGDVTFVKFPAMVATPDGAGPFTTQSLASVGFKGGGITPKTAMATALQIFDQPQVTLNIAPSVPVATPLVRGSNITYVVTATNTGNAATVANATNVEISFRVPAQTTFLTASAPGAINPPGESFGVVKAMFTTLAAGGGMRQLTVNLQVDAAAMETPGPPPNDIVAKAEVTFGPGMNTKVPAPTVAHELSVASLNLTNAMVDDNSPAPPGQLLPGEKTTNTVSVENVGTATASNVLVTVMLTNLEAPPLGFNVKINGAPAAPALVDTTTAGQLKVRTDAGLNGGTLASMASVDITFDANVVASPTGSPRRAQTSATATFTNGGGSNTAPAALDIFLNPSISVVVAATPASGSHIAKSSQITYTITAANGSGVADATGVQIKFPIPAQTTLVAGSPMAPGGSAPAVMAGVVSTTFDTLASPGSGTLTVVVTVNASPTKTPGVLPANDIQASATALYGPGSNPPVPSNTVAHEISAADLTLAISPLEQSIQKLKPATVTVALGNAGPDPATGTKTVTVNLTGTGTIDSAPMCTVNIPKTQAVCEFSTPLAPLGGMTFPLQVSGATPGSATLTASISTTGVEIDETPGNNGNVLSTVTFLQSASDLAITATTPPALIVDGPTQTITYTLNVADVDADPGDPAEGVAVSISIPAQVQATVATFAGAQNGTCTVPPASGGTVTCAIGNVNAGGTVAITLTLQGTALLPTATPVTATATATNNDPAIPNVASVDVTVVPQQVDLSVNDVADRIITTTAPGDLVEPGTFTVTVTNNAVAPNAFVSRGYTLTVAVEAPGTVTDLDVSSSDAACLPVVANVLTCKATALAAGDSKSFAVVANIKAPGPITVRSTVALDVPEQADPTAPNNTDLFAVTRNLPPDAQADLGPTLPTGSTLVFDVLANDTDGDAGDIPNLVPTGPFTGTAGLVVTVEGRKLKVVVPAGEPAATLTVGYAVTDGRGTPIGSTPVTLKLRVAPAVDTEVDGSFGELPPSSTPQTFGVDVPPDLLDATTTTIDLVKGDLGESADDAPFVGVDYRLNPAFGPTTVAGSAVVVADDATATGGKVASYTPAKGYTSDAPVNAPVPTPTAPPDSFAYTATGTLGGTELFNVAATASVKVRNQLPIGLDTLIEIFPGTIGANAVPPIDNDLDGNTVADPVVAGGSPFVFDDRGRLDLAFRLKILCIGPEPAPDPVSGLPPKVEADECAKAGMKAAGQELKVAAPADSTGNVSGSITATLKGDGAAAFRQLAVMIDATVTGTINLGVVVVDNYGGAAWSRVSIRVPDTPPTVLPGEQTVPKNSPPVEVFDTVKGTRDINREVVIVSSVTDPANGTATISADRTKILYEPDRDYVGPDSLDLNVSDASSVGSNSARMSITVREPVVNPVAGAGGGGGGGGASPAGSLPATGGDPLALTAAGGLSLLAGAALVQASRRRRSLPLLAGARHLRS